jgi:hypothetical protein
MVLDIRIKPRIHPLYFDHSIGKWVAHTWNGTTKKLLGTYDSEEEGRDAITEYTKHSKKKLSKTNKKLADRERHANGGGTNKTRVGSD